MLWKYDAGGFSPCNADVSDVRADCEVTRRMKYTVGIWKRVFMIERILLAAQGVFLERGKYKDIDL